MLETTAPLPKNSSPAELSAIFNREAQWSLKNYPQLRGKFAIVNVPAGKVFGDFDQNKLGFNSRRDLVQYLGSLAKKSERAGSSMASKDLSVNLDAIVYTPLPFKLFTRKDQPADMEVMATLDHELGHLVVGKAMLSADICHAECAADVFAVLRHIQRYGDESAAIRIAGWRRAFDFAMTGDTSHFTTLAIDKVQKLREKLDIASMTPAQTAELAKRIALEYTPHIDIMRNVGAQLQPVREALYYSGGDIQPALVMLAKIALREDSEYHVFKIGSRVLERFLTGEVGTEQAPILLQGRFWDDVRLRMKKRSEKMDRDGILTDMPMKGDAMKASAKVFNANDDKALPEKKPRFGFGAIFGR